MNWLCSLLILALGAGGITDGFAQTQPPGSTSPKISAAPAPARIAPNMPQFSPPPAVTQAPPPQPPGLGPAPKGPLDAFLGIDALQKEVSVPNGTPEAKFSFNITNISTGPVTINYVQTSCGCTVAQLPSTPWILTPNEHGQISATMQLAGTPAGGTKIKTLTINSDKGTKALYVKATVLAEPAPMTEMDRTNNAKMAAADRQAVFKGDCIRCHVTPAKDAGGHDKMGQDLYTAVCGICHNAEHQASFVPNLHRLPEPTSADFWRNWIMHGKPGSLMPAFAKNEGGILSNEQIESIVQYLSTTIPPHPVIVATPTVKAQ
jgi:mono/diheme cytochrome c family protein